MRLVPLIEQIGEGWTLAGLSLGLAFGCSARRLRFRLRSAVIEFSRHPRAGKLTVWPFAFATAVLAAQLPALPGVAWCWTNYAITEVSFDPHPIQAPSFTNPSSEAATRALFATDRPPNFDVGLVPGVFVGSFIASALLREFKLEGHQGGTSMRRCTIGATATRLGGMPAGSCAVGAGLSGAAVFAITSWITLCSRWAAAALTDRLADQRTTGTLSQAIPGSTHAHASTAPF